MQLQFTIPEMHAFMAEVFPQLGPRFEVVEMRPFFLRARMAAGEADLRPGGTVSGPALFALADCAYYMATLALIGREALTVTTSCAIDFMRKPAPGRADRRGARPEARPHAVGRRRADLLGRRRRPGRAGGPYLLDPAPSRRTVSAGSAATQNTSTS